MIWNDSFKFSIWSFQLKQSGQILVNDRPEAGFRIYRPYVVLFIMKLPLDSDAWYKYVDFCDAFGSIDPTQMTCGSQIQCNTYVYYIMLKVKEKSFQN